MKAVALIGNKKSGKTTLAVQLCAYLQEQGMQVAAAKFSHHRFDRQDTDTSRLARHASVVAGIGPEQSCVLWPRFRYVLDLLPLLAADVLVIEGGRSFEAVPRIVLPKEPGQDDRDLGLDLARASWQRPVDESVPVLKDIHQLGRLILDKGFLLPGLDCGACGRSSCADLAREIVGGEAEAGACQSQAQTVSIRINGQPLHMNPFVASIISGGLKGMLSQLKGYAPGRIEIELEAGP